MSDVSGSLHVCLKCRQHSVAPCGVREWNPRLCSLCWAPVEALIHSGHVLWRSDADPERVVESTPELAVLLGGAMSTCAPSRPVLASPSEAALILREASSVLLVAGAGLSAAVGVALPSAVRRPGEARWQRYSVLDNDVTRKAHRNSLFSNLCTLLKGKSSFCFTTNIDGILPDVFGEDRVMEVHGSVRRLQCAAYGRGGCSNNNLISVGQESDAGTKRKRRGESAHDTARCTECSGPLRLNVTTEDDTDDDINWSAQCAQMEHYRSFLSSCRCEHLAIIVLGIGSHTHSLLKDLPVIAEQSAESSSFPPRILVLNDVDPGLSCGEIRGCESYALVAGPLEDSVDSIVASMSRLSDTTH